MDPAVGDRRPRRATVTEQLTFDDLDAEAFADVHEPVDNTRGWRGPTACTIVEITYRQLDYWARTGLVRPSIAGAKGSGSIRLYSFHDLLVLRIVKRLLDAGVSLPNIRVAVDALRGRGVTDLSGLTLVSDGVGIYECTTADEVVDLLSGGQGVFGIAVSATIPKLREDVRPFAPEAATGALTAAPVPDELAQRRARVAS
ncbi:MerR family transcriptional regulator [Mycobacterium sp. CBMA335]|nr:MerR family transcriptional regulator [Mycolicibacterium sp. CBMA 335]